VLAHEEGENIMNNINECKEFDLEVYAVEVSALRMVLEEMEENIYYYKHEDEHMKIWRHMRDEIRKVIKAVYKDGNLTKQKIKTDTNEFVYYTSSIERCLKSENIHERKAKHLNNVLKRLGTRYCEVTFDFPKGYVEERMKSKSS
jgi:transcription initiation factor IIE alpha subunit